MKDTYICKKCKSEWVFIPEDYDEEGAEYPSICPLCAMPINQMFIDVYKEEGIIKSIKELLSRIKRNICKH